MDNCALLLQKSKEGSILVNSINRFGFAVKNIPFPDITTKNISANDVIGEDGERVFFPDQLPLAPFDLKIELVNKGELNTLRARTQLFVDYLTGKDGCGTELKIFSKWIPIGYSNVYFKSIDNSTFKKKSNDEYVSISVTFRITNPTKQVVVYYGSLENVL